MYFWCAVGAMATLIGVGLSPVLANPLVPGFTLTNIAVSGAGSFSIGADGDFDPGDTNATINLAAGENVTISYTNTKLGSIAVVKDAGSAAKRATHPK